MPRTATENIGLGAVRIRKRRQTTVRFYALDGTLCVLIEADSEDDARHLCREVSLEFIGPCER